MLRFVQSGEQSVYPDRKMADGCKIQGRGKV